MNRTRIIIVDGIEIHTSLSATEIADLEQKNKELINKIKFNEKSRRKMQQSLMKQIDELEQQYKKQKEVIDKAVKLLGNYKHYSTPDEKQNSANEDLVNNAFDILKEVSE